ncbi:MAG: peptidylprolyl isomerase, partial [Anaerolineales bacterium]|nr:peptidylprolyl isomerase [Anaerolineales bacterium]
KKKQVAQSDKTIQYVAIAAIVVVVALLAWSVIRRNAPAEEAQVEAQPTESLVDVEVIPQTEAPQPTAAAVDSSAQSGARQYDAPPPMTIDVEKKYFATFEMEKGGEFVIELYADKAPITVNSFVFLAREGFFDGVTFHRVLEDFMAQGGDPTGTGGGGPGYKFVNEDSDLTFDKEGVVAMANAGRDTNGSQFFITFGSAEFLNGNYTIFGQVIEGMDVVNSITFRDPNLNPNFTGDVIKSITITEE